MTPAEMLADLFHDDIDVRLADDGLNVVVSAPTGKLTDHHRRLVRGSKPELIGFLLDVERTTALLIAAAMRCCDRHGDGAQARDDMRQQCKDTPPHLRQDLLDHFNGKPANH
ncbi:hypothetical protein [Rhodoferax antarcticus]|uniref:TubC N-terminal docking domain-containing protein n=1 Tax=Rhodoferax antarcticus ANT.BR TaxID=1111071 RepID=A0A1Q8YA19_9BURK|nr:hypothetical protein [Rhodoferax antarcticus]APW47032.1 hypothetical protein RA876_12425 [Rhodoferax antarcticus]OLP04896.1 hypothetical protein BLL52_3712 [Rhodoferax antarcticus ANT.BR]